jgi:glycosyltransferase involved in cell wall biosynthesis
MIICHITTVHTKDDNRIFYKECKTLFNNGFNICMIVAGENDHFFKGIKIFGLKKHKNRFVRFFKTSIIDVLKTTKKVNADVYHFHDPELIISGLFLKLLGKKVIYDIHENNSASIISKPYLKNKLIKYLLSKTINFLEKFCVRFFDAIVTARPDISEKFNHRKLITLRNFPILENSTHNKELHIKNSKRSVIYVGGMSKIRGIEVLIDAFNEMPEYNLLLLGPIKEHVIKNKIQLSNTNVKYLGTVEPFEVFKHINEADIGIVTFLAVPNHVKTLATKPFEYMACGKPMIMSNFNYWKDTFRESSLYVNPLIKSEIINVTRKLMNDDELYNNMSKLNFNLSKNTYNWDSESKKLIKLYKNL